jgi:TetR/AcrR family transcriptional regulator, mexCD-oprJ operon repressor
LPGEPDAGSAGRRADARRNIDAILTAARDCLCRDPDASIADIAAAAGVGRVTVYGHFPNRAALVDAVAGRSLAAFDAAMDAVDLSGDPRQALQRLVSATWKLTADSTQLVVAAERALPPARVATLHERPAQRVLDLIKRGQRERAFRTDLPASWLVSVLHGIVHAGANEVAAHRMTADEAGEMIASTLLAAFTPLSSRQRRNPRGRTRAVS